MTGTVTATAGEIGGFSISSTSISSSNDNLILRSNGEITGSDVLLQGGEVGGWEITTGSLVSTGTGIGLYGGNIVNLDVFSQGRIEANGDLYLYGLHIDKNNYFGFYAVDPFDDPSVNPYSSFRIGLDNAYIGYNEQGTLLLISGSSLVYTDNGTTGELRLDNLSNHSTSVRSLMLDSSNIVGYRDLEAGAFTTYTNGTNNRIITSTGTSGITGEANFTFDGTNTLTIGEGTATNTSSEIIFKVFEVDTNLSGNNVVLKADSVSDEATRTLLLPDNGADNTNTLAYFASGNNNNRVLTANGSNGVVGEGNLTFNGSTLNVTGDTAVTGTLTAGGSSVARWRGAAGTAPSGLQDGDMWADDDVNPPKVYVVVNGTSIRLA
jgi:hypothetical protein